MENLQRVLAGMQAHGGGLPMDPPAADTSEQIYISSLALLKMLKHGRAGVPMEVMGLLLGDFVDDYTVRVVDVFAMPQSGTAVSVEAVDPVFQTKMLDMLKQTGTPPPSPPTRLLIPVLQPVVSTPTLVSRARCCAYLAS